MAKQEEKDFQKFLDENQYSFNNILKYEKLFGRGFVSTGGAETTEVMYIDFICIGTVYC